MTEKYQLLIRRQQIRARQVHLQTLNERRSRLVRFRQMLIAHEQEIEQAVREDLGKSSVTLELGGKNPCLV